MHEATLLERLERQRLIPGRDDRTIAQNLDALGHALTTTNEQGTRERILHYISVLHRRAVTLSLQPGIDDRIREGCYAIIHRTATLHNDQQHPERNHAQARILISFRNGADTHISRDGITCTAFTHIPFGYAHIPSTDAKAVIQEIRARALEATVEKEYHIIPQHGQQQQWNLELIGIPEAWDITQGTGVHIGIADTGCAYDHEEIAARFGRNRGYDFVHNTENPYDDNGHGTHVAGTAAGKSVGVAPESTLYALKFLDRRGVGYEVDFIRAAEWAIRNGIHVLNGSFGSRNRSAAEQAICDELERRGILFAAAAGNSGTTDYEYPASYSSVLSVAAVDRQKKRAPFSQKNDRVRIAAPGVDVRSCVPGGYREYSGTSMATPHVAGTLALARSTHEDSTLIKEALLAGAERLGDPKSYGAGLVRADLTLRLAAFARKWAA